jgi:hypothetical protein
MSDHSKYEELVRTRLKNLVFRIEVNLYIVFAFKTDLRVLLHSYTTA